MGIDSRVRYSYGGSVVALAFLWLSMTPSLLPRDALFQGVVSGASAFASASELSDSERDG